MAGPASELNLDEHSVENVYRVAVLIEQGGYDFYSQIAERSDNPRVKNEVVFLRDEEARHKAFFQKQLKSRGLKTSAELSGELQGWLDREFVNPMEQVLNDRDLATNEAALQLGVRLEQKTIDLYEGLRAKSSETGVQQDLQNIIEEEHRHKEKLNLMLSY